jgi:hypothetical protein
MDTHNGGLEAQKEYVEQWSQIHIWIRIKGKGQIQIRMPGGRHLKLFFCWGGGSIFSHLMSRITFLTLDFYLNLTAAKKGVLALQRVFIVRICVGILKKTSGIFYSCRR